MNLNFMDFEIPLLKALVNPGVSAKPADVYPEEEGFNRIENVQIHETGKHHSGKRIIRDRNNGIARFQLERTSGFRKGWRV
jgi:hypothetical protein